MMVKQNRLDHKDRNRWQRSIQEKEYTSTGNFLAIMHAIKSFPPNLIFALSNVIFFRIPGITKTNDVTKTIKSYFDKELNLNVKSIKDITSSDSLPASSGNYTITDEIKKDIGAYLSRGGRKHYLVDTGRNYKIFVVRINNKKGKVLNTKNIFSVLGEFYRTFCTESTKSTKLLSQLEEDILKGDNEIHQDNKERLCSDINTGKSYLEEAKTALETLKKATNLYFPIKFDVDKGLERLVLLKQDYKKIEKALGQKKVVERPVMETATEYGYPWG